MEHYGQSRSHKEEAKHRIVGIRGWLDDDL
jgi:hypothetical protein